MPGESGLQLISHIRKSSGNLKELPIIVLSACAFESDKQSAIEAGASLFIPKPFSPHAVVARVRELTILHAMGNTRTNA
jgi:DNA-binding response OmpR family regulator